MKHDHDEAKFLKDVNINKKNVVNNISSLFKTLCDQEISRECTEHILCSRAILSREVTEQLMNYNHSKLSKFKAVSKYAPIKSPLCHQNLINYKP